MKKLTSLVVLVVLAFPAWGCDEACKRDRASVTHGIEFPGYLSWKFCEDTRASFMEGDIPSLENYRHKRLNIEHRVRMKNIQNFVEQRKEWLLECDKYLELTERGRMFQDEANTAKIFAAMDSVSRELKSLVSGSSYASDADIDNSIIAKKFDELFKLVDDHKARMSLKGQFVSH